MFAEIFWSAILSAVATVAGSAWIDKLYDACKELTFPDEIASRSKFRRPILFCALTVLNCVVLTATDVPEKLFLLTATFLLMLMTVTDFEQYMLFDAMTAPLALLGAAFVWQTGLSVQEHLTAAIIGGGIFFGLAFLSKGALGGGDVKLIAALGLWLGYQKLLHVVLLGAVSGGLAAVLMILLKQKDRSSYFAYGPYFALAAIYVLLCD
ncbi:MAG: prepilin peptidase [Quinella sp. 1Q7]|nr:prepilin peptidase [Quinella sp. 1Q7]